ncbi:hypothetical protein Bca101_048299 [Brassica carinata]
MEVIKFQKVEEACCSPAVTAKTHLLQRQRSGEELRACRGSSWYFRGGFRREGKAENIEGKQTIKIASSTVYMEEANYGCEEANYLDKRAFYNLKKSFQGLTSCERHKVSDSCMEAISMNACREQLVSGLSEELKGRDCLEWWIQKLSALERINHPSQFPPWNVKDHNYIRYRDLPELERRVGQQLESVRLDDLLLPFVGREESMYDVVMWILSIGCSQAFLRGLMKKMRRVVMIQTPLVITIVRC